MIPNIRPIKPATPFKMTTEFSIVAASLPSLRFGRRYRLRLRPVDLAGNSLDYDDAVADLLTMVGLAIPLDPQGLPYLRFEPVAAPLVALRQARSPHCTRLRFGAPGHPYLE